MRRVITLAPDLTDEKIAEMIRKARWNNQMKCPHCASTNIEKAGHTSKLSWRNVKRGEFPTFW